MIAWLANYLVRVLLKNEIIETDRITIRELALPQPKVIMLPVHLLYLLHVKYYYFGNNWSIDFTTTIPMCPRNNS